MRIMCAVFLLSVLTTERVFAQATGLPTFFAPTRAFGSSEVGATLSRPGADAIGIELRLGAALNRADLAFRIGYVDPEGSADGNWAAGAEARFPVIGRSQTFPLDGGFIFGVGHIFASGGGGQTLVPVGLALGRRLVLDGGAFQITPYIQPTIIFEDETLVALGLGIDLRIRGIPDVRLNWGAGDMDGFSVSLYWSR